MGKLIKKLARVDRQAFNLLTLPFGVERVERQRAFPTAASSSDHNELIARDLDIDVLEVVGPRTDDANGVGFLLARSG